MGSIFIILDNSEQEIYNTHLKDESLSW